MNDPTEPKRYAYDSDRWWPAGLPEWIGEQVAKGDELFAAIDKGLRSFGWPAYNVPHPLPMENSWPGLTLAVAQRTRETLEVLRATAWNDADGPCWCPIPTEVTDEPHVERCARARAALGIPTEDS